MILPDFDYMRPDSLEGAVELLGVHGPEARLVAGGTDLFPNMKNNLLRPQFVISLRGMPVREPVLTAEGNLRVDANTSLADLVDATLVHEHAPLLAESALEVASGQIRQMGTLGGNLCQESRCLQFNQSHEFQFQAPCYKLGGDCCYPFPGVGRSCLSVFMSDTAPALLCMHARLELLSSSGPRNMPLADLYTGDGMQPLALDHGEILAAVLIPPLPPRSGTAFVKYTCRGGLEFAVVSVAVMLRMEADGITCAEARVCLGSVAGGPVGLPATEALLAGRRLDAHTLAEAGQAASEEIRPVPHHEYSLGFLRHNIRVYTRRALAAALERTTAE